MQGSSPVKLALSTDLLFSFCSPFSFSFLSLANYNQMVKKNNQPYIYYKQSLFYIKILLYNHVQKYYLIRPKHMNSKT